MQVSHRLGNEAGGMRHGDNQKTGHPGVGSIVAEDQRVWSAGVRCPPAGNGDEGDRG